MRMQPKRHEDAHTQARNQRGGNLLGANIKTPYSSEVWSRLGIRRRGHSLGGLPVLRLVSSATSLCELLDCGGRFWGSCGARYVRGVAAGQKASCDVTTGHHPGPQVQLPPSLQGESWASMSASVTFEKVCGKGLFLVLRREGEECGGGLEIWVGTAQETSDRESGALLIFRRPECVP